jgi:hypothetical protein
MTYYRIKTAFKAEPAQLYAMAFGDAVHSYSYLDPEAGLFFYGFEDAVTPADLGPLVRVELVTDPSTLP